MFHCKGLTPQGCPHEASSMSEPFDMNLCDKCWESLQEMESNHDCTMSTKGYCSGCLEIIRLKGLEPPEPFEDDEVFPHEPNIHYNNAEKGN